MYIARPKLAKIIHGMLGNGMISLDEEDIIDWDDDQLDFLTLEYLKAFSKDEQERFLFDCMDEINTSPICANELKNALYARIEDEVREPIIEILIYIKAEDEKHRRAEHEYSQAQVY